MMSASVFLLTMVLHACASVRTGEGEFTDARADFNPIFTEVWDLTQEHFIRPLPNTEEVRAHCRLHLLYGDLAGCLSDPLAKYLDAKQLESVLLSTKSIYAGIGIEFFLSSGQAIVSFIAPNAPAVRSGAFRIGDVITQIDGRDIAGLREDALDALISGDAGSSIDMVLMREGALMTSVTLVREAVELPSVIAKEIEEGVFSIQLKSFDSSTAYDYMKAIAEYCMRDGGMASYIIQNCMADKTKMPVIIADGRNNPGGLLNAAGRLCGFYARQPHDMVVTLKSYYEEIVYPADNFLDSRAIGVLRGMSLIVMLNEESASAMEIFASCVREAGALIVGVPSYGKGTTQNIFRLMSGDAVRFTTHEFLMGNKRTKIDGVGVAPDYEVREPNSCIPCRLYRGDAAHDPQFAVALELAREVRQNLLWGINK